MVTALRRHSRGLLAVGIVASLVFAVALQRGAINDFEWRLSWAPFSSAVVLFAVGPIVGGTCFWLLLRDLAPGAPLGPSLWVWERSFAARYIPSGALTVVVRLAERDRLGATRGAMLSATVFEQLVAAGAAAAVSLAAFSVSGRRPPLVALAVLVLVLVLAVAARPAVGFWGRWRARERSGPGGVVVGAVGTRALLQALVLSSSGWLVAGGAAWVFVRGVTDEQALAFAPLLAAYTFAWLVGFVVPFAPSGLGAREATLVALLAPSLGIAPATALTVGLRLANVAGDLLAIGAIEGMWLLGRRRRRARSGRWVVWGLR